MSLSPLASSLSSLLFAQDDGFIGSPMFFVAMAVLFLGLIGLLVFLRNKQSGDE
jgi:hypothetical protein